MIGNLRMHWRLGVLLLLVAVSVIVQQNVLPLMEGADEPLHTTYAEFLRQQNRLPDRATYLTNPTRQESGQPPLAYWLASLLPRALNLDTFPADQIHPYLETVKNRWFTPPDLWNRYDNLNVYLHGDGPEALNDPPLIAVLRALRWSSLGWGLLAVLGAYLAAWEVFHSRRWALVTAAVFGLMPTFLHLASAFTNDIGAIALGTLLLWRALCVVQVEATSRDVLWIGFLLGVGILIKISVALLAPVVGLALILAAIQRPHPLRRLIGQGLLLGAIVGLLVGPWLAFGWLTFDDPFGFRTHVTALSAYDPLLSVWQVVPLVPEVYLSYLGKFGASIYLRPATYTILASLLLLAESGYLVQGWVHRRNLRLRWLWKSATGRQVLVLGTAAAIMLAGLLRWLQSIRYITGRLLYPAHLCTALLVAGGLYLLSRHAPYVGRAARLAVVGGLAAIGLIGTPLAIRGAYQTPILLTADELPVLEGTPLDFAGTIRLLGYQQPDPRLTPGGLHEITLCWEVQQPTERAVAFSVKIVHAGEIMGSRTSLLGMGHYPSQRWQADDRWCDRVNVPVEADLPPGQVYDVLVDLLDAATQDFDFPATTLDGTPVELPFVTQVISPAGNMPPPEGVLLTATGIEYPGLVALEGYALQGEIVAGADLRLDLLWRVEGQTPDDWQVFVHLIGPAEAIPLAGGPPREGAYPTWAWAVGEHVAGTWTLPLPEDLPPGEYALGLGFFLPESGARLPVLVDGQPVQDDVALLTSLKLEETATFDGD